MTIYNINGQTLSVEERGQPNRQAAILIHGWSSSWYAMSPLMGLLSQRFHCLAVDLPGYGKSPRLEEKTTIEGYADLLADFIDEVSDGPVVLIGHSMGGMISLTLAEKYPMLVERMVLICPTITGQLSTYINLFVSPITFIERFGLGRFISGVVEKAVIGVTDQIMRPASFAQRTTIKRSDYARLRMDARRPDQGRVRAECFLAMRENNLSSRLKDIKTASLVLWGAEDNTVPLRDSGIVADEWPTADLRILPKAGHWPHFERPDATKRTIANFLGLPYTENQLYSPVADDEFLEIEETAQFLAHSDIGTRLNIVQRRRLAAQCERRVYQPGERIVEINDKGNEMFIIQNGTVDVLADPNRPGEITTTMRKMATLRPGQITGEMSLFDEGVRTANLNAGSHGALVLVLHRDQVEDLCEDDPVLGARILWNISRAISLRVRFIQWQNRRKRQQEAKTRVNVPNTRALNNLRSEFARRTTSGD